MTNPISIALFPTRSPEGLELQESFCALAQNQFNLQIKNYQTPTQSDLLFAVLNYDLVVVDATIEEDYRDSNYSIFMEIKLIEHVLVVSRTYLPINFYGFHAGGAPDYLSNVGYTNASILQWLSARLESMLPSLPRAKTMFTDENLEATDEEFLQTIRKLMENGLQSKRKLLREQGQVFISYRNKYYPQVMELKQRIEAGEYHQGIPKSVKVIPNGSLVWETEILTPQRRWGIVCITYQMIVEAEEMWIYHTPDYFDSWWTQSELAALHYRNQDLPENKIKLRIYDPKQRCLHEHVSPDFTFHLDQRQQERMHSLFFSSDDITQSPELIKTMRLMRFFVNYLPTRWSDLFISFVFSFMNAKNLMMANHSEEDADYVIGNFHNPKWRKEYFNDYIWHKEYWEYSMLKCIQTAPMSKKMDLDDFFYTKQPLHIKLTPNQLRKAVQKKKLVCPGGEECPDQTCRAVFQIIKNKPRYRWMPSRSEIDKHGDDGSGLCKLPTYCFQEEQERH